MPNWNRALVTGASSGIGACIARDLAADGTDLVLVARSTDTLAAMADELRRAHRIEVEVLPADLGDPAELRQVETRLVEGPFVDLLVNNAGFGAGGRAWRLDLERQEQMVRVNVLAPVRLTHAAVRRMEQAGRGGILNVASLAAVAPIPSMATYGATKAFLTSFTEALHEELAGTGIAATVVCPGFIRTGFADAAGVEEAGDAIPDALWMQPEPVARAALAGIAANRAVVVPGTHYRLVGALGRSLPSGVTRRIVALGSRLTGNR